MELVTAKGHGARRRGRMAVTILFAAAGGILLGTVAASVSPSLVLDSAELLVGARPVQAAPAGASRTGHVEGLLMQSLDDRQVAYYMAKPEGEGTWPGLVLAHEGWGLDGKFKAVADRLASEGFVVIAPDLNRGRIALDPDKAREFGVVLDENEATGSLDAVAGFLKYLPEVGNHRVGLVGFDIGGALALKAAMRSTDVSAVVIIYGPPVTDVDSLRRIGCPVLGVFGGDDALVPRASADKFRDALAAASRTAEVKIIDGVGHGFMSGRASGENVAASEEAWSTITGFLRELL